MDKEIIVCHNVDYCIAIKNNIKSANLEGLSVMCYRMRKAICTAVCMYSYILFFCRYSYILFFKPECSSCMNMCACMFIYSGDSTRM